MEENSRTLALEEYLQHLDIQKSRIQESNNTTKCPLKFNAVFSFSITMWIHLNNGDDGLRTFLHKICDIGDTVVIEPQPWKCYKKAVSRMKKSNCQFPLFKELKITKDVENEIERIVLEAGVFSKVCETERTKWERKVMIFKRSIL